MKSRTLLFIITLAASWRIGASPLPRVQSVAVTGSIQLAPGKTPDNKKPDYSSAAVWIKRVGEPTPRPKPGQTFKILQQNKRFLPHVLAIPMGSRVEFPNLDLFFHNVFSLFEGKRFDLGLYEAGGKVPTVSFDRAGICYVFCNIHPEMSAVVVSLDTEWYALSDRDGRFTIANVPSGKYQLFLWHERFQLPNQGVPREITVKDTNTDLGVVPVMDTGNLLENHKNKYGQEYERNASGNPTYNR